MDHPEKKITVEFAKLLRDITFESLSRETVEYSKVLLLDHIGCMLVGSTAPWTQPIYKYMTSFGGRPQARVLNHGSRVTVHDAAFVNSVFGQGCEWDDFSGPFYGAGHAGAGVWPIILAMGEFLGSNGRDLIAAGAAGYECMTRLGKSVRPGSDHRGFHEHGIDRKSVV